MRPASRLVLHSAFGCLPLFVAFVACSNSPDPVTPCTLNCGGESASGGTTSAGGAPASGGATMNPSCPTGSGGAAPSIDVPLDTNTNSSISARVLHNHLGYLVGGAKRAVVRSSGALTSFQITTSDTVVFEGQLEAISGFSAWGGTDSHYVADFTTLRTPGTYQLRVNGQPSENFAIATSLYLDETLADVVGYFKSSRADDTAVWSADANVPRYGSATTENVQGGWYDASGDVSKYLSHLSYANHFNPQQIPLVAYAFAFALDRAGTSLTSQSLTDAARSEALWGADYLVRVQSEEGFFFTTVFDNWTGDLGQRDICAFEGEAGTKTSEYQAGFREGGGLAVAALARISALGASGASSSADYLNAAQSGFAHLQVHNLEYLDDGQENIIDDYAALLAASELFAVTSDSAYLDAARTRSTSLLARLTADGYFSSRGSRPFWHASDAGLPVLALVRYSEIETDADARSSALAGVKKHLDYLETVTRAVPNPYGYARQHVNVGSEVFPSFFIPHDNETGYWWQGENARLASLAAAAFIGGRALSLADGCAGRASDGQLAFAQDQLDWILGKNPEDMSFLNGSGRNNPPGYCSEKPPYQGTHAGGISNGITGREDNGGGLQWRSGASQEECWRDWRWLEQWLPHSSWYLIAIASQPGAL